MTSSAALDAPRRRRLPWWAVITACLVWVACWSLTPGLLAQGPGHWVSDDLATSITIETSIAVVLAIALLVLHPRYDRTLFARSWTMWLYVLPLASAVTLPLHYHLILPVLLYAVWTTVSVFWQDYVTFGLLQSYLGERLARWVAVIPTALLFWLGHALFIPDRFAPQMGLASVAILALGLAMASLRAWLGTIHAILALHLTFYFVFS